jgi:dihydrofolate reductase
MSWQPSGKSFSRELPRAKDYGMKRAGRAATMRKVLLTMFMTLDGRALLPDYPSDPDEDPNEVNPMWEGRKDSIDTIVLGRTTYLGWAAFWPKLESEPTAPPWMREFSHFANSVQKVVFSKTLKTLEWGPGKIAAGDPVSEVKHLKSESGRDIAVCGGVQIAHSFLELGLVDEVLVEIFPSVVGRGQPLFPTTDAPVEEERIPVGAAGRFDFRLKEARPMSNGTVFLHYERRNLS